VLDPLASNIDAFLTLETLLLAFLLNGVIWHEGDVPHTKTLSGRQYSFQQVTPFSSGTKVLDPTPSKIDSFLTRDTVFVPFTRMELFGPKVKLLTSENIHIGILPFKN
jgi:hypothetical protein